MTSHDVVARLRRALGTRRVGHAGTLDPMATGTLVIGVDKATRLLGYLALDDKDYLATIRLGSATTTDDREGQAIAVADPERLGLVDDAAITAVMELLTGTIDQRPSAVSAIKVDGRRAHARVRAGEDVELAPRTVTVSRFDVLELRCSDAAIDVDVTVTCSSGTYVRALARDLGAGLGVGGHLTALRRTRVGPFDEMVPLDEAVERGPAGLMPIADAARRALPTWTVGAAEAQEVRHGRRIAWAASSEGAERPVAILDASGDLLALARESAGTASYLAVLAAS